MSVFFTTGHRQTLFEVEVVVRYLLLSKILNHQSAVTPGQVPVFRGGRNSLLSCAYMVKARPICLLLLAQAMLLAFSLARDRAGSSIAARIAIIAITTSSSISVKAAERFPACLRRGGCRVRQNLRNKLGSVVGLPIASIFLHPCSLCLHPVELL